MANKKPDESRLSQIRPGTPQMAAFLQAGYPDMTPDKARQIIEERAKRPEAWPYEVLEKAQAYLAAYEGSPVAIDTDPHWSRK